MLKPLTPTTSVTIIRAMGYRDVEIAGLPEASWITRNICDNEMFLLSDERDQERDHLVVFDACDGSHIVTPCPRDFRRQLRYF